MKLQKIAQVIEKRINVLKYEKEQKFINKYFKIYDNTMANDTFEKMQEAKKTIANYAKNKGVAIEVYDAKTEAIDLGNAAIENSFADKIKLVITDLKTKAEKSRCIYALDDKNPQSAVLEKTKNVMVYDSKEGVERMTKVKSTFEENFLRYLYRNIEELTKSLKV